MAGTIAVLAVMVFPPARPGEGGGVEYRFVPDTDRLVGIMRVQALLVGRLDEYGEFHQTARYEAKALGEGLGGAIKYSGPHFDDLNSGLKGAAKVYEFRSGMLIPGRMGRHGNFVPEEGGKITSFADYKYSPSAVPIWNLPGRFEPSKPIPGVNKQ